MFCQTCGSSHNESAKFCETCGTAFQSRNTKSLSNSNIQQSTCADPSCSNGKQPLSFQDYMESRLISPSQDVTFTSIQKRKTNERISEGTKMKAKKDEIVKVLLVFTQHHCKHACVFHRLKALHVQSNRGHWEFHNKREKL